MSREQMYRESLNYIQFKLKNILKEIDPKDIKKINESFSKAHRIFVYGAGRSGLVAKAFAIRLVHLGYQTFAIGETIGAPVKKDDMVFIVSGSGETIPAVMTAEITRNIGAKLVVITERKDSRITKFADIPIILSAECEDEERKIYAPLGTLFEASAWIFLDAIIAELMKNKDENEESMRSRHATLE